MTTRTKLLALAGAITPVGAAVKRTIRPLAAGITPSGSVTKTAARLVGGAITTTGSVLKLLGRLLAGATTPAGALVVDNNVAPIITPPERTVTVLSENRTLRPEDNRAAVIAADTRTMEA